VQKWKKLGLRLVSGIGLGTAVIACSEAALANSPMHNKITCLKICNKHSNTGNNNKDDNKIASINEW